MRSPPMNTLIIRMDRLFVRSLPCLFLCPPKVFAGLAALPRRMPEDIRASVV
jgi:hypothetical protein